MIAAPKTEVMSHDEPREFTLLESQKGVVKGKKTSAI
jgi:hypothetical protein